MGYGKVTLSRSLQVALRYGVVRFGGMRSGLVRSGTVWRGEVGLHYYGHFR